MLVSHQYRFIFVKTRKTAGTSIELSLSRYCDGPDDVITPISSYDEPLRSSSGVQPKNYLRPDGSKRRFRNHASARRIRAELGEQIWSSYFTFCFERNPWDRVVSQYWFRKVHDPKCVSLDFDDFIRKGMFTSEYWMYSAEETVIVGQVSRFENIADEMRQVCSRIGLAWDGWLPRAKGGFRKDPRHYTEYYTPELANIVEHACSQEIRLMRYSFS